MDLVLSFFSDLILFSFGLAVCFIWIIAFVAIGIEVYDTIKEIFSKEEPPKEEEDDV